MTRIASWAEIKARLRDPGFLIRLAFAIIAGHLTAAFTRSLFAVAFLPLSGMRGYVLSADLFIDSVTLIFKITVFAMIPLTAAMLPLIIVVAYGLKLGQLGSVAAGAACGHLTSLLCSYLWMRYLGHSVGFPNLFHTTLAAGLPSILAGMSFGWLLWLICFREFNATHRDLQTVAAEAV